MTGLKIGTSPEIATFVIAAVKFNGLFAVPDRVCLDERIFVANEWLFYIDLILGNDVLH